jgi:tripartite-type tricarboxylate transporter receptor subunit TctC
MPSRFAQLCIRCTRLAFATLVVLAGAWAGSGAAQTYPARPVRILVGVPPGGSTDQVARLLAQHLALSLGEAFFVDNRPGAGGTIAYTAGASAAPDGYTLMLIGSAYAVAASVYRLPFDPVDDIMPIGQIAQGPMLLVVNPALPAQSTQELIALAKSKPGALNYASGQGNAAHLASELFASMAGIRITHVPYKGGAAALLDTISGRIDVFMATIAEALPQVRAQKVRALAVTTPTRLPALPDVPTVAESGVPGYEVVQWYGLVGPKGMPAPIVERLNQALARILGSQEVAEQLQREGMTAAGGAPDRFHALLKKGIEANRKVVAAVGLKVE